MAGVPGYYPNDEPPQTQEIPVPRPTSMGYLGIKTLYCPPNKDEDSEDISLEYVLL